MPKSFLNKIKHNILLIFLVLIVAACATISSISMESDKALRLLQFSAVESLPAGKRKTSENARTFYSNYFVPRGRPQFWREIKKKTKLRYYATITILGDQRPYTIEFTVFKEKAYKDSAGVISYSEVGRSEPAAKAIMLYFQKNLEKSLKDRNVIDDFRVF
ncbi:MAG: hypothetical protein KDD58_07670 [Bdellovibrionales bacterium]|nr:hypothetical protein [Bdellovibrionales bacterium]